MMLFDVSLDIWGREVFQTSRCSRRQGGSSFGTTICRDAGSPVPLLRSPGCVQGMGMPQGQVGPNPQSCPCEAAGESVQASKQLARHQL